MQTQLAQAILDSAARRPAIADDYGGRFNVYRNNYRITLHNALRTTFTVIERLVGADFFAALANAFVERHPPHSPIMSQYGDAFPAFLDDFAPLSEFPYLADVARVEYARVQAYHAADGARYELRDATAATAAFDRPSALHPSVHIIASAFPVHTIWLAQFGDDDLAQTQWLAETALVWRHGASEAVAVRPIDVRELALLSHCAAGGCLTTLLASCPDEQDAASLITSFLQLAADGVLMPATPPSDHGDTL
ncbi:MAG: DUF2063 domain-containing protein [Erythrobacter sp.]|nr:DUF2063 domain-containing protein [Erythrobacter sp.]MBA4051479.1 DUF2063 domain-containing protein [Erythrobacter sp.]MBA4173064.1 DUF2063 domain-containing protein [Hyphomicrobium sp.]